jgi:hypothetical protein
MTLDQRMLLLRAFYRSDVRLCAGDHLILSGIPENPRVQIGRHILSHRARTDLRLALQGLVGAQSFPSPVEVRCPER